MTRTEAERSWEMIKELPRAGKTVATFRERGSKGLRLGEILRTSALCIPE